MLIDEQLIYSQVLFMGGKGHRLMLDVPKKISGAGESKEVLGLLIVFVVATDQVVFLRGRVRVIPFSLLRHEIL